MKIVLQPFEPQPQPAAAPVAGRTEAITPPPRFSGPKPDIRLFHAL